MKCISYKKGYKYQLQNTYVEKIKIFPKNGDIIGDYLSLTKEGELTIKEGYAWDGPSGPTIDTLNFMRASLVHDALYQLMRHDLLERTEYRKPADKLLFKHCRQDGMGYIRAKNAYLGLRLFGEPATKEKNKKEVIWAPRKC